MKALTIGKTFRVKGSQSIGKYINEITPFPVLTPEEEASLVRQIQQGDKKAIDKMIKSNLKFIVSIAKKYYINDVSFEDLINEANIALIQTVQKGLFDETKGMKFISYAVWGIRQAMFSALAQYSFTVKLPFKKYLLRNTVKLATEQFEQEFERSPTSEELARMLKLKVSDVELVLRCSRKEKSLDESYSFTNEGDQGTLLEVTPNSNITAPDARCDAHSLTVDMERCLQILPIRTQNVLILLFGLKGYTALQPEEVATKLKFGKSGKTRVLQLKREAFDRLKANKNTKQILLPYLG